MTQLLDAAYVGPLGGTDAVATRAAASVHVWVRAVTLFAVLVPLWCVRYIPGTDLPSHLAIANVLADLARHDPVASHYYAINLQPIPYHLVYLLLAPLVAWCGPFLAAKIFLSAIAVATVLAGHRLFRALAAPWWATAFLVFINYGMIFFWGFLPTIGGIPVFIFGLSELVLIARARGERSVVAATVGGLMLMVTHVALVIPWVCALLAMWATGDRRVVRASIRIGLISVLPLVPMVVLRLIGAHGAHAFSVQYEELRLVGRHLVQQFGIFDRGVGLATHLAFLAGAGLLAAMSSRVGTLATPVVRMVRALTVLSVIAYFATPMAMDAGGDFIWAFNVRLFFVAETALFALLVMDRDRSVQARDVAMPLLAAAHLAAMVMFFKLYDTHARASEPVLAAIPEGATLAVASKDGRFEDAWPPLMLHMHGYYLASRRGYDGAVFAGAHIPISVVTPVCPSNLEAPRATKCDFLFAEGSAVPVALQQCTAVIVSGSFALVRDCGRERPPEQPTRGAEPGET